MGLAERAYRHLPATGQSLALSLFGLKYRWDRRGPGFGAQVSGFEERERWPAEEMHAHTTEKLRRLLTWSYATVPYYRARWTAAGIEAGDLDSFEVADLDRLPLTPKEDIRRDPYALLSTSLPRHVRLLHQHTSGSTGTPTTILLTRRECRQFLAAREARSYRWAGASIGMPRSTIGSRIIVPDAASQGPYYRRNLAERQIYLSATHISPRTIGDYVASLNRHRPMLLTGYAHSHHLMARLMLQTGSSLDYRPRALVLSSDTLTRSMKSTISEAFGAPVFEEYGSVENCVLATECTEGGLHVSPDFGILEILAENGGQAAPGETGRVVCTGLLNLIQPLIRYEIGDLASWSRDECTCGRQHFPTLAGILGRVRDVVLTRDGRWITLATGPIFSASTDIVEGQVIQEDLDSFTVQVIAGSSFGPEQAEKLSEALRARVGNVQVQIRTVQELEKTSMGKSKAVISRLDNQNRSAHTSDGTDRL